MYREMTNIYIIFLACILTLTFREMTPYVIGYWKRVISRISRKSNVSKRLDTIEQQIENIASRVSIREKNIKQQIRDEVKSYLEKLAK